MKVKTKPWQEKWEEYGELAQGGQGIITELRYKTDPNRRAILKRIISRWRKDIQALERLQKEAETMLKLHGLGARVPKIYDSFINHDKAEPFILMEFIKGIRFDEWLKIKAPVPPAKAVIITRGIAETIKLCHQNKIGHRDLKPSNIILKNKKISSPYVLDFGIAFDSRQTLILTKDGEMFWNEFIILPECQDLGGGHRDLRSDITALAGIFFACLTGYPPIVLRDAQERKPHHRHEQLLLDSTENIEQSEHLGWFFDRAFSYRIDDRFQTLDEFMNELTRFEDSGPTTDLDLNEQFNILDQELRSTDRNIQIAALQKKYAPIRQRLIEQMQVELKTLKKQKGEPLIGNRNIEGIPGLNLPHVKNGDMLQKGDVTHFNIRRENFHYEAVVLLAVFGVGMQIHLYCTSYNEQTAKDPTPEKQLSWSKIAVFDETTNELSESKKSVIIKALKAKLAQEIRNLARKNKK